MSMETSKIVAIPLMPGKMARDGRNRSDLSYAKYALATWTWWCERNGAQLVLLDRPLGGEAFASFPPTVQRWLAPRQLLQELPRARLAMVDADTMVRWDTPDFFGAAGDPIFAVRDVSPDWTHRTIKAHQPLFPGVRLPWWEYFNAGLVVSSLRHSGTFEALASLYLERWPEIRAVQEPRNLGTDQTPLNFMVRSRGEAVRLLDPPFNAVRCFPLNGELLRYEYQADPDWSRFDEVAFSHPETFEYIEHSYVWHFSNVVKSRARVMAETWRRVRDHYPGLPPALRPD
jgi:hypothetical protein